MDPDLKILTLTLIGEARGEPVEGIIGVGCVIRNRGTDYKSVCLSPKQFSCWNPGDPNLLYLNGLNLETSVDKSVIQCIWVAQGIFTNQVIDNVLGAKNYVNKARYTMAQLRKHPKVDAWILNMKVIKTLGSHVFLK